MIVLPWFANPGPSAFATLPVPITAIFAAFAVNGDSDTNDSTAAQAARTRARRMTTPLLLFVNQPRRRADRVEARMIMQARRRASEPRDRARLARELEDVQARRRAVERVDVAAVVEVHVVRLDRALAFALAVDRDARLGRVRRDLGDEVRDLDRHERVADVDHADARVEVRDHDQ